MSNDQEEKSSSNQDFNPSSAHRKKGRRKWLALVVLIIAGGSTYYWQQNEEDVQVDEPLILQIEMGDIENTIASAGSLKPRELVDVGAQVSGQLQKLFVEVGDLVEEGQILAEVDARVQENRVEASRANIEAQEAQIEARRASLELARANKARQERLMNDNATSQLDYDNAVNNLISAEASLIQLEKQIVQSKASLSSDETQLEYTRIYAPAAGTVVSIAMTEGRTLNASQQAPTILTIADLSTMTVETDISEADIGNVKRGLEVYFTTLGGGSRRWYSTLRQILPTPNIDNNVVLYTGLFVIENDDSALYSEMTAQVYFITSSANNVLTVPVGALTYQDAPAFGGSALARAGDGPSQEERAARVAEMRASGQIPGVGGGGGFQGRAGGASQAQLGQNATGSRPATVELVNADGTRETREILVGVTSRVSAEVLSGLKLGDRVVAGILQASAEESQGSGGNFRGGFRGF
jgi:membrane fusion protein, macrolide-specific efflux system